MMSSLISVFIWIQGSKLITPTPLPKAGGLVCMFDAARLLSEMAESCGREAAARFFDNERSSQSGQELTSI
jgi:hypothetical protein